MPNYNTLYNDVKTKRGRGASPKYEAELIVKDKLRKFGYRVEHMGPRSKFDLLVDKYRVEVRNTKHRVYEDGKLCWPVALYPLFNHDYDILAVVLRYPTLINEVLFYTKDQVNLLFRKNYSSNIKDGVLFSEKRPERMWAAFTNPRKAFGALQNFSLEVIP